MDSGIAQKYGMPFVSVSLEPRDFISADQGIYFLTMLDPFGTKQRRNANFELFETDGARISSQYIELSLHGNGSLGAHQKSMRAYFKKNPEDPDSKSGLKYDVFQGGATDCDGNAILQYDRLIMRNSGNDVGKTMMRDAFIQRVSETLNLDTQASRPSLVFINGEFWGLYNLRERYDDKYFASHYGISDSDVVMLEAPTPLVTGNDNTMYEVNEGAEGDEQPFIDMFNQAISTDLSVQANYEAIASQMDVDNYIDFFIANIITCNYDWPGNNIKVWRNKNENQTKIDNKWRWVMADMDHGYGFVDPNNDWSKDMMHHALDGGSIAAQLFRALLKNEGFKQKFVDRFVYAVNEIYDPDKGIALIDEMAAEREKAISLQSVRWPADGNSVSNFNYQVGVMRTFAQKRPAVALSQMYAYLGLSQTPNFKVVSDGAMGTCLVNNQSAVDGVYVKDLAPGRKGNGFGVCQNGFCVCGLCRV